MDLKPFVRASCEITELSLKKWGTQWNGTNLKGVEAVNFEKFFPNDDNVASVQP